VHERCVDFIPRDGIPSILPAFDKNDTLQRLHVVMDIFVIALEELGKGVDVYGSAAVKLLQQVETPGCDVAEEGARIFEIDTL
jgi:hypothetical protein